MIRRHSARASRNFGDDPTVTNPLETVANLADVMLVFAVALMLAIVSLQNVDVSALSHINDEDLSDAGNTVTPGDIVDAVNANKYKPVGTVYQDIATGEIYWLEDTEGSDDGTQ
jgi:hypothetical protein